MSSHGLPTSRIARAVALAAVCLAVAENMPGAPPQTAAVPVTLPDLVLEGPQFGVSFLGGILVSYTVRNVGGKDSTKATTVRALCFTDYGGSRCYVGTGWNVGTVAPTGTFDYPVPPLKMGESVTIPVIAIASAGNEAYKVTGIVTVDPDNLVPESNETNNRSTFSKSRDALKANANAVGVPPPTPVPSYGSGTAVGVPVGGAGASPLKPTPTPVPVLTLIVDPAYTVNKQLNLFAKNGASAPTGAGTTKFDCKTTSGDACNVEGALPLAVPALGPGQLQFLGKFSVPPTWEAHTLTITTVGVASKPLVLKYP